MGYNPFSKFPQITHLKYKTSHTNKMNPATVFSAVVAVMSVGSANALFGADIVTTIAAAEPASCVKQLICDIATGTKPSENDIILSLFENETPVTSPKFDFAVAASLGKQLKSVEACELRYTCPVKL